LTAKIDFISPQAEFTPPVIFSNESRSKLVFMVEARPADASRPALKPGQPVQVRLTAR
jgi:HlyD family secretion protein